MTNRWDDDRGAALLTVILMMAVLVGITGTMALITQRGVDSTRSDTSGTAALGQGEAGVAQAIEHLRSVGVKAINDCATTTCTSGYGSAAGRTLQIGSDSSQTFTTRITPVVPLNPPTTKTGVYRIDSRGDSTASGRRSVQVDVEVKVQPFPFGIYTAQSVSQGGGMNASNISIFTGGCVNKRSQIQLTGTTDLYYGGPPAAHAVGWITDSNNGCSATDPRNIHRTAACNSTVVGGRQIYAHDQDAQGGPVGSPCTPFGAQNPAGSCEFTGARTSKFTQADLSCYNPNSRGLSASTYDQLKRQAMASGTYYTTPSPGTYPAATMPASGVVYFDLNNSTSKAVSLNFITTYEAPGTCGSRSVIVIVEGGNATMNAGASIVGALFVPDGDLKFNGNSTLIGTIYAKNIDKGAGGASISLQPCFVANPPGQLMSIKTLKFRELDR